MRIIQRLTIVVVAALGVGLMVPAAAQAQNSYEIRITNLTRGQILSPPVIATHAASTRMFLPGHRASSELAALAEDADSSGLLAMLGADSDVSDVVVGGGVILPGTTATFEISGDPSQMLSLAAMLVSTNDAFLGVDSFSLANVGGRAVTHGVAYDAGSENNSEDCSSIPGPPCGNGGVRATRGAEKYVHVHAGLRGNGDLPLDYDWRNPVARIVIIAR